MSKNYFNLIKNKSRCNRLYTTKQTITANRFKQQIHNAFRGINYKRLTSKGKEKMWKMLANYPNVQNSYHVTKTNVSNIRNVRSSVQYMCIVLCIVSNQKNTKIVTRIKIALPTLLLVCPTTSGNKTIRNKCETCKRCIVSIFQRYIND